MTNKYNFKKEIEKWLNENPFWENEELGETAIVKLNIINKEFVSKLKENFCKHLPRKSNEFCNKCYRCNEINKLSGEN